MNSNLHNILSSQNWDDIMEKLHAHAISRFNWFGLNSEKRMQGKEAKDFPNEAVTLVWEGTRKWNTSKEPDLLNFLKGVVNSLIYNTITSKERRVLSEDDLDIISDSEFVDLMLEENLIHKDFIEAIEYTLLKDPNEWLVFISLSEGMTPKDIHEKYGVPIEQVRNDQKRLRRHIKKITDLKP